MELENIENNNDTIINEITEEECIICFYKKPINEYVIFDCKHKVCIQCYCMISKCPLCLEPFDKITEIHEELPGQVVYIPRHNVEIIYRRNRIDTRELFHINNVKCIMTVLCMFFCGGIVFMLINIISSIYAHEN